MGHVGKAFRPSPRGLAVAVVAILVLSSPGTFRLTAADPEGGAGSPRLRVAPFTCDVSPPLGHPLCGGWITPARKIVDRQFAHGLVVEAAGAKPIVLCAVDWCWIRGEAYDRWRETIAEAVGTVADRVALHCVHPHDAPMADVEANRILAARGFPERTLDEEFFADLLRRCATAVRAAGKRLREVTHIGAGKARVEKVGSNRRIVGKNGKVGSMRGSSCRNAELRAKPEGLIDPWLRCVSFWNGKQPVAALHYYATHPMSYYGRGGVSSDFCGLARERLRREDRDVAHVYFTGCGGDVAAGKYNDGSEENRPVLTARMYRAMKAAFRATQREPISRIEWRVEPILLPVREEYTREYFTRLLETAGSSVANRVKGAMGLAWRDRFEAGKTVDVTCLKVGSVFVLHLPGEALIRWQLLAQEMAADSFRMSAARQPPGAPQARPVPFVAVAAYGDCGPAYFPTADSYPRGGYEVGMAWVSPKADTVLRGAMNKLLRPSAGKKDPR